VNAETFDHIVERRIGAIRKTLKSKGAEYATDEDRLHNFVRAGALKNESPAQACWGFMVKHIISIQDMVKDPGQYTRAVWQEKLGDLINYSILLEAIADEARSEFMRAGYTRVVATGLPDGHTPEEVLGGRVVADPISDACTCAAPPGVRHAPTCMRYRPVDDPAGKASD
jgi:hypothetical protein